MRCYQRTSVQAYTAVEMAAVDKAMFAECGLDILQVMETAGRSIAVAVRDHCGFDRVAGLTIGVLAGRGGNGGDALVAARYLRNWGAEPEVWLGGDIESGSAAGHQLAITRLLGIPELGIGVDSGSKTIDLVVDGLLGFGLSGPPTGRAAQMIEDVNGMEVLVVAIDVPSGLDATTGEVMDPCIQASMTVTLAGLKTGLLNPGASAVVGRLLVADIGVPALAFDVAEVDPPGIEWTGDFVEIEELR